MNRKISISIAFVLSSIFTNAQAPGNEAPLLGFWIKSNAGTSSIINNTPINGWSDQSTNVRNASQGTAANQPKYFDNATDNVNFNPIVYFNDAAQAAANADHMEILANGILPPGNTSYSVYTVVKPAVLTAPGKFLFSGIAGPDNFCSFDVRNPVGTTLDSWNGDDLIVAGLWSTSFPVLFTFNYTTASSTRTMFANSLQVGTRVGAARTSTNVNSALGYQKSGNLEFYNGSILEIATYPNTTNIVAARSRIESYLSIKWGLTRGTTASTVDYVNTAGTVIWNRLLAPTYQKNIIGIGRDDAELLSQKQSKSTDVVGDILTMYIGPAKTVNQAANTGTFTSGDLSYFMAGTDGAAIVETTYPQTPVPAGICCRLLRQWFSQRSNFTNADLKLEFDFTSVAASIGPLVAADFRLLIDDNGNFANATVVSPANASFVVAGSVVTCTVSGFVAAWLSTLPYFTLGSVATTTPLPIDLANFAGTCVNGFATLNWTTKSETNNSYFTIERSIDGISFTTLGTVQGSGTTSQTSNYFWTDENPFPGTVYYRLSQTDNNGVRNILSTISQNNCVTPGLILLYPNPFSKTTTLHLSLENDAVVTAEVYTVLGQVVKNIATDKVFTKGENDLIIDMDESPDGLYLLRVVINGNTTVYRILKQ